MPRFRGRMCLTVLSLDAHLHVVEQLRNPPNRVVQTPINHSLESQLSQYSVVRAVFRLIIDDLQHFLFRSTHTFLRLVLSPPAKITWRLIRTNRSPFPSIIFHHGAAYENKECPSACHPNPSSRSWSLPAGR